MNDLITRTPQIIAVEINSIKGQTRKIMLQASIEIGRRLTEAKAMLEHGQWGGWLKESVDYSQSTAENLMRIFEEYGDNQLSLFETDAKSQTLGNLTYSKAVALLGIPSEEREAFVEENDVAAMSTRELQQALKEKDEAVKRRADAEEKLRSAVIEAERMEQDRNKALEELDTVKAQEKELARKLAAAEKSGDAAKMTKLEKALAEERQKVKQLEEDLKKPIEPAIVEKEVVPEAVTRELEDAKATALRANAELETMRARAVSEESPLMVKFRLHFETLTGNFGNLLAVLGEMKAADPSVYDKYRNAVSKLIGTMTEKVS